jgi:hypothetical protein
VIRAASHKILLPAKNTNRIAMTIHIDSRWVLDGNAQGIILAVIFQAIDAKFCNRASFRQRPANDTAARSSVGRRIRTESSYSQLRGAWHASC